MTSSRNDGLTGLSLWSFDFLAVLTTGFHCFANASLAAVAFSAWMCGLVLIQPPWRRSGIVYELIECVGQAASPFRVGQSVRLREQLVVCARINAPRERVVELPPAQPHSQAKP